MSPGPLMLDLEGTELAPDERALLMRPEVGGVILFSRNIVDPQQVKALVAEIRATRPELLLAVDQEGGRVQRLRNGFTPLPPMRRFGDIWDVDRERAVTLAEACGALMAAEALDCGLDISFAPVLDLDFGQSLVIGDRAFHRDAAAVTALAGAFVHGMNRLGMQATGKHFPGHGFVAADSHVDIPRDGRLLEALEGDDLVPFRRLAARLGGIMPAHVIYPQVAPEPAGFSPYWLQDVLRGTLGFSGVIFSDDLSMEGATVAGSFSRRAAAALDAGCDMVLVCNHRDGALQVLDYLASRPLDPQSGERMAALAAQCRPLGGDELVYLRTRIAEVA